MRFSVSILRGVAFVACLTSPECQAFAPLRPTARGQVAGSLCMSSNTGTDNSSNPPNPQTFREAEVLGLKYMQEAQYEEALDTFQKGLKLPGSRSDVVRTKLVSGPSPVGGSAGGTESKSVQTLDEFEIQAAYYNMACAHAQLNAPDESLAALRTALENGFDNFATVRSDPDLALLQKAAASDFEALMEEFEPQKGFNPFGLFNKNK